MLARKPLGTILSVVLLTAALAAAPLPWKAAEYRGLLLGRAHREDVLRALGSPDGANKTNEGEELTYKTRGEHHGDLTLKLDRAGVVTEIQEAFPVSIPRTRIYKELGDRPVTERFSTAACAGGSLYRDPRGVIELTLYPQRGIALWPDQYGYDFAAILYLAKQPGLAHRPACVSLEKSTQR